MTLGHPVRNLIGVQLAVHRKALLWCPQWGHSPVRVAGVGCRKNWYWTEIRRREINLKILFIMKILLPCYQDNDIFKIVDCQFLEFFRYKWTWSGQEVFRGKTKRQRMWVKNWTWTHKFTKIWILNSSDELISRWTWVTSTIFDHRNKSASLLIIN